MHKVTNISVACTECFYITAFRLYFPQIKRNHKSEVETTKPILILLEMLEEVTLNTQG
jgi:hypothetical protein